MKLKTFTLLEFHQQRRSNNASGVAGVHLQVTPAQPLGFWQATIRFQIRKRMSKTFSVRKFRRRRAFALAVAARSEMLARVENRAYLYHSVATRLIGQK